jgi:hypothetical protein
LELRVNQELRLDLTMEVAKVSNISVDATILPPAELKKDSASLGTTIENRQVAGLPLDGRNFFELGLLVPGAAPAAPGSAGSVRGDFSFSVNGAREDGNNFARMVATSISNTYGVRPPLDAIREFEMLTSSDAIRSQPGRTVNVVHKSSTRNFHGSVLNFTKMVL